MSDLFSTKVSCDEGITENEKFSWLRLIRTKNIGPVSFYKLIERYGSAEKAIEYLPSLTKTKKIFPASISDIEKEVESLHRYGAEFICATEKDYPLALAATDDAPPVITIKGHKELLAQQSVGIVGSRNASLNGRKFAESLAHDLGKQGQIITSGFARGIDTSAHTGSLETGTIAAVAGGIDIIYPEENKALYNEICEKGCFIAESPFGQVPYARSFPKRNRIISGLSAGVVVIEASLRSGSLITARLAAEQGRDVFAVPGFPSDPRAQGTNKLISDGAILVQSAEDIVNTLQSFTRSAPMTFNEKPQAEYQATYEEDEAVVGDAQSIILAKLSHTPIQQDELLRDCSLDTSAFSSALLELEITGQVQRYAGGKISLLR